MSAIREFIPLEDRRAVSALYADFAAGRGGALAAVGGFRAGGGDWKRALADTAAVDGGLVDRLVAAQRALGVSDDVIGRLEGLRDGSVRAVVTGQQPGVAGGPMMTLHKIATACALAAAIEKREGTRCVPVYWMGADDDDFTEIRDLVALSKELAVVSASIDPGAYVPGRRVGDIDAESVRAVIRALAPFLPEEHDLAARLESWTADATDLAGAAARIMVALTGGSVAIVDGREAALRTAGKDVLLRFFDAESDLRERIAANGRELVGAGYHAQLELGTSSGLFEVADGVRRKVPPDRRDEARERFVADITRVTPGVVARNLLQDAVLAPVAVVLGPAEIAYRAQLGGVYEALGVARPVVFPRMTATFLPPALATLSATTGVTGAEFAGDARAAAARARDALADESFGAAADHAGDAFGALTEQFTRAAADRLDVRSRDKLEKRFADIAHRLRQALDAAIEQDVTSAAARYTFLPRTADIFERNGASQERFLSMTVPYAFHGDAAWREIRAIADDAVGDTLDGRVGHRVYSIQ
jgi:hypothetical protein